MKKTVIFLILNFMILFAFGQELIKINYQEMNLTSKKNKLLEPVDYGSFYAFQIDDINKFLFQVTIEGENIKLDTPVPTELQNLFRLSKQQLDETLLQEELQTQQDVDKVEDETNELKTTLKNVNNNFDSNLLEQNLAIYKLNQKIENTNKNKNSLSFINMLNEKEALENKIKQQNKLKKDIDDLLTDIEDFSDDLNKLLIEVAYINVQKITLINLAIRDVSFAKMKNDIVSDSNLKPKDPLSNFKNLQQRLDALKIKINELKPKLNESKVKEVDKNYKKVNDAFKSLKQDEILTSYSQVLYLFNELQNLSNFTAKAPPVQANGDFINYEITITPSKTHELGAYKNPMTFDFDVPVKGGLKVDFSVGPIFAFGVGALDEKFYFQESDTENTGVLKRRENNNALNPGIAAMMHFYKRSGENVSWGGLFGVGAGFQTIEDINLSFYSGISLVLGKEQKIMLNTGLAFMNVDRLKNGEFEIDSNYDSNTVSIDDVTEKVFKSSFFISLSYSLASRTNN